MSPVETVPVETVETPTNPAVVPRLDDGGDHDRFAHYVKKDKILQSAVEGLAVIALCGKKWVPSRDPKRYPVCPACKEIFEGIQDPGDGGSDGGDSGGDGS